MVTCVGNVVRKAMMACRDHRQAKPRLSTFQNEQQAMSILLFSEIDGMFIFWSKMQNKLQGSRQNSKDFKMTWNLVGSHG